MNTLNREQAVTKARQTVIQDYGAEGRKWLVGKAPDCYGNPKYGTEIHVLEGSPARGYVIDLGALRSGIVLAMDMNGNTLKKFEYLGT